MKIEIFFTIPTLIILSISLFSSICISFGQEKISPLSYDLGRWIFLGALGVILFYVIAFLSVNFVNKLKNK